MNKIAADIAHALARGAAACVLAGALGACMSTGKHRPGGNDGGAPPLPDASLGALSINEDGEIVVVDAKGQAIPKCVLRATEAKKASECRGLKDTDILEIRSMSIVTHTGSNCTTIGPIIHGGRAYYYQLPPGCGH